jgi:hypothetical protein
VRHEQHGDAQAPLQRQDFAPHLGAKLGVEVRQRLVHQADRRLRDDGAPERDTLLLATGQLRWAAFQQPCDAQHLDRAIEPARAFRRRHTPRLQAEQDVLGDRQVREQGVGLEHHRDAARGRRQVRHVAAADLHAPLGCGLQAGDDAQAGRLAAAGGAEQHGEAAGSDVERNAIERGDASPPTADAGEPDGRAGAIGRRGRVGARHGVAGPRDGRSVCACRAAAGKRVTGGRPGALPRTPPEGAALWTPAKGGAFGIHSFWFCDGPGRSPIAEPKRRVPRAVPLAEVSGGNSRWRCSGQ